MESYQIKIGGYKNPKEFVEVWASRYMYPDYEKYQQSLPHALEKETLFKAVFEWKNGTKQKIAANKAKLVHEFWEKAQLLIALKQSEPFDWEAFERDFTPKANATIWKIFLLHLINPDLYPIFDQHVYRSYCFFTKGSIEELPKNNELVYNIYKNHYLKWVLKISQTYSINLSLLDKSLFAFGKALKGLSGLPIQLTDPIAPVEH